MWERIKQGQHNLIQQHKWVSLATIIKLHYIVTKRRSSYI